MKYVIATADNVGYDINLSEPVETLDEAKNLLKQTFKSIKEDVGDNLVKEETKLYARSFKISSFNGDLYYGQIKEIGGI